MFHEMTVKNEELDWIENEKVYLFLPSTKFPVVLNTETKLGITTTVMIDTEGHTII